MEQQAVAFMVGTAALALGFSLVIRWQDWLGYMRRIREQGKPTALLIGYLHLIIGTFIVGFHWKWNGLPLLTTLIGVKAIVEGFTYTLFPAVVPAMMKWYEPRARGLLRITGLITIVVSLFVLYEWWTLLNEPCAWQPCFNQAQQQ